MIRLMCLLFFYSSCTAPSITAQQIDMKDYNGMWSGEIHPRALSHDVVVEDLGNRKWQLTMSNKEQFLDAIYTNDDDKNILLKLDNQTFLRGEKLQDGNLSVFINSTEYEYHILMTKKGNNQYSGRWNTFYVDKLFPAKLFLAIEEGDGNEYAAYPLMMDDRFRGTYVDGFSKTGNLINFSDSRTGYAFQGVLNKDKIDLSFILFGKKVTTIQLSRDTSEFAFGNTAQSKLASIPSHPAQLTDGLPTSKLSAVAVNLQPLKNMVDSIASNGLTNVHSVLIAKNGNLVYENYFNGFHADIPHDQRSAAKSLGSAIVGIALEEGILKNINQSIYDYIPTDYQYTKDDHKAKITLKHLLTMSSGFDAIDFGIDRMGQATEDNYQNSSDWLKTVLEAPMIFEAGTHCNYGSANPYLLSVALANTLDESLLSYIKRKLYDPLGITNYSISKDDKGDPYFGGGSYLIPRDMIKFGELYRNKGIWKGQRLISEQWVSDSFKKYAVLENTSEKNGYGYLWWHKTYQVNGKEIKSVEARGAGGQYIAIIDELDMTIVITSGNYRNGRYWQPDLIIESYLLPVFVE